MRTAVGNEHRLNNQFKQANMFGYRGYGRSEGSPSEGGIYLDAEAALDYLRSRQDINQDRIVLFGRSLGCAVGVEMATRHDEYAVIRVLRVLGTFV